jgi:hypothetical protein
VGRHERPAHDVGGLVVQAQVVERELEGLTCAFDERGNAARDLDRGLASICEGANVDQFWFARSDALYARFFAW